MVNEIRRLNLWLGRHLKYISVPLVIILPVLIADFLIKKLTIEISHMSYFLLNTALMIIVIVLFSFLTGSILKRFNFGQPVHLSPWWQRNLLWVLLLIFLLVGVILNVKYAKFTAETEAILRNYSFINQTLNFFSL